jgi:hypothetical protein
MARREFHVEARSKAAVRRDKVTQWIMLLCASLALVLGIIGLYLFVSTSLNELNEPHPASSCSGLLSGFDHSCASIPTSSPAPGPSPSQQAPESPTAILLGGYVLCSLIAFLVGLGHALAHYAWRWVGCFLSPPLLLIIPLVLLIFTFNPLSSSLSGLISLLVLLLVFVVGAFLFPMVCLAYAILQLD